MSTAFKAISAVAVFLAFGVTGFYGYLHIADIYWPLDVEEAIGPQSTRFIGAYPAGFIGLAVGGPIACAILSED